jgi:hypothetical protein
LNSLRPLTAPVRCPRPVFLAIVSFTSIPTVDPAVARVRH